MPQQIKCPCCGVGTIDLPRHHHVGERIAWLRERRGLSQSELADHMGLHRTSISNIEAGRHEPRLKQLPAYAAVLGVSSRDLII